MVSRSNSSRLIALLAWLVTAPAFLVAQTPAPTTPLRLSFADAVTQTRFDWSSVARVRAAGAQADGSRAERGVTVEGAASTAALAYLRAARGQAAVAARQADSALAAELVGLAQAQKAAGVSGAIDVTRARTQLVTAEGLLIVARNQMDRARIDVTRALGLDPATPLTLTDSLASTLGAAGCLPSGMPPS